jgi:glycosyltransferase involved in cell wall biosynthesis
MIDSRPVSHDRGDSAGPNKLGIITSTLPFGSSEAFLYPELRALTELGYEITIFPAAPRTYKRLHHDFSVEVVRFSLLSPMTIFRALRGLWRNMRGARQAMASILASRSRFKTKLKNLALLPTGLAVGDEVCNRGINHIHAYWLSAPSTVAFVAAQVAKVDWSFSAHSFDIFMEDNLISEKLHSAMFGRAISAQGHLELCSRLKNSATSRLEVIHLGVDAAPEYRRLEAKAGRLRLLCPAYLLPVKGHTYLLEALRSVVDAGIDCHCVFAGEGRLRRSLAQRIRNLGLEGVVSMPGMIRHDVLLQQLHSGSYDAVVIASVQLGTEFEGIPVSLMEAMAAGVPCIATRTGAIAELLDSQCGILVDQRDSQAISDAIIALARDPVWRRALGERARQRIAEQFDARASANSLVTLIGH